MTTTFNFTKNLFNGELFIKTLPVSLFSILDNFSYRGTSLDVKFTIDLTTQQEIDLQTVIDNITSTKIQWLKVREKQAKLIQSYLWVAERHERQVIRSVEPLSNSVVEYNVVLDYMQEVRDVDLQTDPFNIIWPTKPT